MTKKKSDWMGSAARAVMCCATVSIAFSASTTHGATDFDQPATPEVLFGSGNLNGSFTTNRQNGVELAIRGKLRFDANNQAQNIFNSNSDGTYTFDAGAAPAGFGFMPNAQSTPVWSFEWSVNSDFDGSSGFDLDDLTYELGIDFDPGVATTNFLVFDPITPTMAVPFYDHAIGDNATANGAGTTAGDAPTYSTLLANNNVAQNSWNMEFFNNAPFNTFVASDDGQYDFYLAAFDGAVEVARVEISIIASAPAEVNTAALSQNGWYSDDTRADGSGGQSAGTNLISPTLTDDPEASSDGVPAHDADILNQISFGAAPVPPPAGEHSGSVHLNIAAGSGSGKSQISHRKDDATGHAPGSVFGPGLQMQYSWMGDGTPTVTASVKFGVKTSEFSSTGMSSRTGENAWDKVLIYEPGNLNGGTSDGTWQTEVVDYNNGQWWFFDRTNIAGSIGTPLTLADMSTSSVMVGGRTISDVYDLITDAGAIITSVQVGIGSGNAGGSVYVNQLETNFYRSGSITTFGATLPVRNLTQDQYYPTISSAVAAANAGDVISVASGTYSEGNITLDKSLTLLGANAGAHPEYDARGPESTLTGTFILSADDIVIDGFAITGSAYAVRAASGGSIHNGIAIRNNDIFDTTDSPVRMGLGFGGGVNSVGWDVSNNRIQNILGDNRTGLILFNIDDLTVHNNIIRHDSGSFVGRRGTNFDGCRSAVVSDNVIEMGSTALDVGTRFNEARYQMQISNSDRDSDDLLVQGNTFNGAYDGIVTLGNGVVTNLAVLDNVITDNFIGFRPGAGTNSAGNGIDGVELTGNLFADHLFSALFFGASAGVAIDHANVAISSNAFESNFQNVDGSDDATFSSGPINGSGNWWGSSDASTIVATFDFSNIGANFDYTPWLDNGTDVDGATEGFQGDFATLNVDDDSPQSGATGRVQEAIDLVSGSTVNILPGTYIEVGQVVLDEDITIIGDAVNRPVIMTDTDTGTGGDARGMWLVNPGVVADLSNLVFDGTGRLIWQAIRHRGSGPITNCAFDNIQFNASGPHYAGTAIAAFGDGVTDISQCDFSNIGRIGIQYFGAGISGSTASDINYTGKGVGDFLDYSFDIGGGAVVSIERLSVNSNRGVASTDGSTSAGLIVSTFFGAGTEAVIQDSLISDNTTGIFVGFDPSDTALVTANYNRIFGNDTGLRNTSLTNVVDAEFNFWGAASGPLDDAGVDEAGNPPCFDVATMVNNDGAGNAVESSNVDYCPWLLGDASLTLEIAAGCPDDTDSIEPGHQIEVELWMRDLLDPATGYQAFVTFDAMAIEFKGMLSSYTGSPFPTNIGTIDTAETSPGVLTLNAFDVFNGTGTDADSLLATLVFEVTGGECGTTSLGFDTAPASELSFEGDPLITGNVGTPMITLDDTAPVVMQGAINSCYDSLALAEAAALAATTATDICTSTMDLTTVVSNSSSATCDTTITVRVTDECGNFTDVDYMTRVDSDAPILTPGTIAACYDTIVDAEAAAIAATSVSDNCPGMIDVAASTTGGCDVTITVAATDSCGNSDSVDYLTRIDNDPPTIGAGSIAACYPTVGDAEAAAIAEAGMTASDICPGPLDFAASTVDTCAATVTVTVTDFCGNFTTMDYFTRIDNTPPVVTSMDQVVVADAGMCSALVTLDAGAIDDCDGVFDDVDLVFTIDTGNDGFGVGDDVVMGSGSTFVFDQGVTNVRASATDACGNEGSFDYTVTVDAVNLVNLTVTLDGVNLGMGDTVSRMIQFIARDGTSCATDVCEVVTFMGSPATGSVQISVDCGSWDTICAKDPQHTLFDTVPLVINGTQYDADATHVLRGGDTDNDSDVDINDVTLFIAQFGDVDMGIGSGMNACPYDGQRNADFDLSTDVGAGDFSILSFNWLQFTTCTCTLPSVVDGSDYPTFQPIDRDELMRRGVLRHRQPVLTRIQVGEAINLDAAIRADLNQDGEVGYEDVAIFESEHGFDSRLSESIRSLEIQQLEQASIPTNNRGIEWVETGR